MERLLAIARAFSPESLDISDKLHEFLMKQRARFHAGGHHEHKEEPLLARIGNIVMVLLISMYVSL